MPTVRFTALVKKLQMTSDVQVVLQVLRPDETAPKLVPMRNVKVWVEMETEQPDLIHGAEEPDQDAQMRLTFDETGFQVPAEAGEPGESVVADGSDQGEQTELV